MDKTNINLIIEKINQGKLDKSADIYFEEMKKITNKYNKYSNNWEENFKKWNREKRQLTIKTLKALESYCLNNELNEKQIEDYNSFRYRLYFAKSLTDYHKNNRNEELESLKNMHNAIEILIKKYPNQRYVDWYISSFTTIIKYYLRNNQAEKANKYNLECIKFCKNAKDSYKIDERMEYIFQLSGETYNKLKEYDKAIEFYKKALKYNSDIHFKSKEENDKSINKSDIEINIAETYFIKKDYKSSLIYAKKAYEILSKKYEHGFTYIPDYYIDKKFIIVSCLLSKLCRVKKDFSNSHLYIEKALWRLICKHEGKFSFEWYTDYDVMTYLILAEKTNLMIDVRDLFTATEIIKNLKKYIDTDIFEEMYEFNTFYVDIETLENKLNCYRRKINE